MSYSNTRTFYILATALSGLWLSNTAQAAISNSGSGATSYGTRIDTNMIHFDSTPSVSVDQYDRGMVYTTGSCGAVYTTADPSPNNAPSGNPAVLVDGASSGTINTLAFTAFSTSSNTNNQENYCLAKDFAGNYWSYKRVSTQVGDADLQACSPTDTFNPNTGCSSSSTTSFHASLSRSQASIIATNIEARLSPSSPTGIFRSQPTGHGDEAVNGKTGERQQSSFTSQQHTSRSTSLRELATLISFDTSKMQMNAAGNDQNTVDTKMARENLSTDQPWTVWGHGSYTSAENDRNKSGNDSRYNGSVVGYNIGVDYQFNDKLLAGLSLGYSDTSLTTTYNSGDYNETNWSLTPYAKWTPIDGLTLSALGGYSVGDLDLKRNNDSIAGNTESEMWFGAVNSSYEFIPSETTPLSLSFNLGLLATNKVVSAYTESDGTFVARATGNTRQVKSGLEAAYTFDVKDTTLEPFVKTEFVYDFLDPTNGDNGAYNVGGGLRIGSQSTGFSGILEGETLLGREDYREYSISGLIAYGFSLDSTETPNSSLVSPYIKSNFNRSAQEIGTGISYAHGSSSLTLNLDVTTSMPTAAAQGNVAAMAEVGLSF